MSLERLEQLSIELEALVRERDAEIERLRIAEREKIMNINTHIGDGFIHVCDVCNIESTTKKWKYINIVENIMFDDHRSWLYFIVVNDIIFKVGETGNFLGHRTNESQKHPLTGTKGRLSRYLIGDETDQVIRNELQPYLDKGDKISFWVKKCEVLGGIIDVVGRQEIVYHSTHKDQEMIYLDRFKETGEYPVLNKLRK
jgi:hypothetical protein